MTLFYLFIAVVPASVLLFTAFYTFKKHMQGAPRKKTVRINAVTFLVVAVLATMMTVTVSAADKDAEPAPQEQVQTVEEAEVKEESGDSLSKGLGLLAAGLSTGLAGIGGGIAVAAGAPAAIAATSENPKAFGKSLIFVALGESIALYGVVISILLLNA